MKEATENTAKGSANRRFYWAILVGIFATHSISLLVIRHRAFVEGWNLPTLGSGQVPGMLTGVFAGPAFAVGAFVVSAASWFCRKISDGQFFARSVACAALAMVSPYLFFMIVSLAPSLDSVIGAGMKERLRSEFDLPVLKRWAENVRTQTRPLRGNEKALLFERLRWLPDPGERMVFSGTEVLPGIRRVFGTNVVITIASNSPTEVYTEIAVYGAAILVGEIRDLEVRDHQRRNELAPGVYLWRYLKP